MLTGTSELKVTNFWSISEQIFIKIYTVKFVLRSFYLKIRQNLFVGRALSWPELTDPGPVTDLE